jgi:ribosomal protein S18 acetylase RimI-like enzyme
MNIRRATAQDATNIAAIAIATWVDTYAPAGMNDVYSGYILGRFTATNIAELIERNYVVVAETDFGLVGYALVSASGAARWEIETVYILPRFQSFGIGKRLLDTIATSHHGRLWLKCADYNPKALSFYRSYGFDETGETWFELAGERYRCLVFELSTSDAGESRERARQTRK